VANVRTLICVGFYGSGTELEMSGEGKLTVKNLKGGLTKTAEQYNFNWLFKLKFVQNHYFALLLQGQQCRLSSGYLIFGSAG